MSLRIRVCAHARNDFPCAIRVVPPCVDNATDARFIDAILADPSRVNTISDGDIVARLLRLQALQILGLEDFTFARVCSDPVGYVFLAYGYGAGRRPTKKIAVPQSSIVFEIITLNVSPVCIFH